MPETPTQHASARLLAIVSVDPSRRVICQEPGCGHGVYAAIHVVQDKEKLLVLGSTCFAKRYGGASALGMPAYSAGSGGGSHLTEEERMALVTNTAELIAQFKARHEAVMAAANAKLLALRQRMQQQAQATKALFSRAPTRPAIQPPAEHPWPWQHPSNTSVAVVRGPDSQCWVRVMHRSGTQMLAPWPAFDGWDETFPPSIGQPDQQLQAYAVPNIVAALQWLRQRGYEAPQVSRWPEVRKLLPDPV